LAGGRLVAAAAENRANKNIDKVDWNNAAPVASKGNFKKSRGRWWSTGLIAVVSSIFRTFDLG
jgi:hypothetical protein